MKRLAKFVVVDCKCGRHYVDLYDAEWNTKKIKTSECGTCLTALVIKDKNGQFYFLNRLA